MTGGATASAVEKAAGASEQHDQWRGLADLYGLMSDARRRQFYRLLLLIFASAFAELATIGSLVSFLSLLADPAAIAQFRWLEPGSSLAGGTLAAAGLAFAAFVILAGAVRLQLAWTVQHFSYHLGHEIMTEIQRRVLLQPYAFHTARNSSTIIAAIDKVEALVFEVVLPVMQAMVAAIVAVFIAAALIYIEPLTALLAAAVFAIAYVTVSVAVRKRLAVNSEAVVRAFDDRVKIAQESLNAIRDVIIDGSQDVYLKAFRKADHDLCVSRASTAFVASAPRYFIETIGTVLIAAVAIIVAQREDGLVAALPVLGAIALGAQRLLPLLHQAYSGWSTGAGYVAVVQEVVELLRLPVAGPAPELAPLPLQSRIAVEGVGFNYPGRRRGAVVEADFEIAAGSTIALVGETGSGKSTLADLLMGLIQPDRGRICIDDEVLSDRNRQRWQKSIAHVPQSIFLADTSIARNIALSRPGEAICSEAVARAARLASIDEFIEALPDGYDTIVGEAGVRLSGGQRQRIGIARAIYKNTPVLLLDEATSALDEATEQAVLDGLDRLRADGRTLILIAHRQSTIARCDKVIRLHRGKVV